MYVFLHHCNIFPGLLLLSCTYLILIGLQSSSVISTPVTANINHTIITPTAATLPVGVVNPAASFLPAFDPRFTQVSVAELILSNLLYDL